MPSLAYFHKSVGEDTNDTFEMGSVAAIPILHSARTSGGWSSSAGLLDPAGDTTLLTGDADVESRKESVNARSGLTIRHFVTLFALELLGFGLTYSISRPAFLSTFTTGHLKSTTTETSTLVPTGATSASPKSFLSSVPLAFGTPAPLGTKDIDSNDPTKIVSEQGTGSPTITVTRSV